MAFVMLMLAFLSLIVSHEIKHGEIASSEACHNASKDANSESYSEYELKPRN